MNRFLKTFFISNHLSNFCDKVGLWTKTDDYFAFMTIVIHMTS